jgi:cytochrome b
VIEAPPPAPWRRVVKVWDRAVRAMHWSLAVAIAVAWFSGEEELTRHEWAGYIAMSVVVLRGIWGFVGTPYARFSQFVRRPIPTRWRWQGMPIPVTWDTTHWAAG